MPPVNDEYSDTDSDDGFNEDMEALKRACQLTGKDSIDDQLQLTSTTGGGAASGSASSEAESDEEGEDDLQLVRSIQKRFADSMDTEDEPLNMKPLCTLPPDWSDSDDCEDDYETLRAIQRRFAAYNDGGLKDNVEVFSHRPVQVGATIIDSEKETSNSFVERTNAREGFLNCVDSSEPASKNSEACLDAGGRQSSELIEWNGPGADDVAGLPLQNSHFPKSALAFVDAIKKNRSCQKLIRSKMIQMEARIEELNKLMERVKILKDFQVACKKRTGRALSQKRDARVQLISVPKIRANMKFNEKIPAIYKGPPENSRVSNYKEAIAAFSVSVGNEKWSKEESDNLVKGVKQQFQGMLLQRSVELLSEVDGSYDSSNVDSIIVSIKDLDITPEKMRQFLPKVNWEQLAAMYVPGHSGAECQARFLNCEDPLINHNPWTAMEDKNLLHIIQQKGLSNWIDIAASLGTNRTPFQCLARYQRSLNASILKREWTKDEDNQLRAAVETYGESNWQLVASVMEGRTGTQCSNRWLKTLHPARQRVGKWTAEEDKRLTVAVTLFGPKTWKKVARCVPGRTQVQCRERWVNCLDPSLNMAKWTKEEDSKLEATIQEHGYCWSKVAACIPRRTDNQCWRRWKVLFPDDVPRLQEARKIQKAAFISNFVDRESERPALGPNDFILPETYRITGSENVDPSRRKKRRSRRKGQKCSEEDALSGEICSDEVPTFTNGSEVENLQGRSTRRKRRGKSLLSTKNDAGPSCSHSSPHQLDVSNDEKIRKSRVNDGRRKRKPRMQNEKSGVKSKSVNDGECEHSDPTEECSLPDLTYPNLQTANVSAEFGEDDGPQGKKASKLHPRRRRGKIVKEASDEDTQAKATILKTENEMEKEKKQTDAGDDCLSPFPDSMSLMDIRMIGIKARKTKRNTQEACSNSDCVSLAVDEQRVNLRSNTDSAVSGNSDSAAVPSERDNHELQTKENALPPPETEEENATLASFLLESGPDRTQFPVPRQRKRRRARERTCSSETAEVEMGSQNINKASPNQASEAEVEDDTTLAHFCKLKKRRTQTTKL